MKYVVLSGLPGSGKSTVARRLAPILGLSVLDKDDILDALFDSLGVGDAAWRSKLSRAADEVFCRVAPSLGEAILVSWWRHPDATGDSGTPTTWLQSLPGGVLEIHCVCPPQLAAARFAARQRHAGHLDAMRDVQSIAEEFERVAVLGPLGFAPVLQVSTDPERDLSELVASARQHLARP
jgi:glucokinase